MPKLQNLKIGTTSLMVSEKMGFTDKRGTDNGRPRHNNSSADQ